MQPMKPLSGTSLYNLTSNWTNQDGKAMALSRASRRTGRGRHGVYELQGHLSDDRRRHGRDRGSGESQKSTAKLRFAFFSIDSAIDTPERLKAYAAEHGLDPAQWTLFHGDDKAVRELAAALGVRYSRDASGGFDHSAIISLLDARGEIVFQKPDATLDSEEFVAKIEALTKK